MTPPLFSEPDLRDALVAMGIPHYLAGRKPPSHRFTEIIRTGKPGERVESVIGDWWARFLENAAGAKAIHWRSPPEVRWIDATKVGGGHWGVYGRYYAERP